MPAMPVMLTYVSFILITRLTRCYCSSYCQMSQGGEVTFPKTHSKYIVQLRHQSFSLDTGASKHSIQSSRNPTRQVCEAKDNTGAERYLRWCFKYHWYFISCLPLLLLSNTEMGTAPSCRPAMPYSAGVRVPWQFHLNPLDKWRWKTVRKTKTQCMKICDDNPRIQLCGSFLV